MIGIVSLLSQQSIICVSERGLNKTETQDYINVNQTHLGDVHF